MTGLERAVAAFAAADAGAWPGLPDGVHLRDLAGLLAFDPHDLRRGDAGEPPAMREWLAAETAVYAGGLRLWLAGDRPADPMDARVVLLEGIHPLDAAGDFLIAPDLGAPDASYDAVLGPLALPGGELVYGGRGLALRVNPDNGLLLGLVGFTPLGADAYRARIRPVPEPTRPLGMAVPR